MPSMSDDSWVSSRGSPGSKKRRRPHQPAGVPAGDRVVGPAGQAARGRGTARWRGRSRRRRSRRGGRRRGPGRSGRGRRRRPRGRGGRRRGGRCRPRPRRAGSRSARGRRPRWPAPADRCRPPSTGPAGRGRRGRSARPRPGSRRDRCRTARRRGPRSTRRGARCCRSRSGSGRRARRRRSSSSPRRRPGSACLPVSGSVGTSGWSRGWPAAGLRRWTVAYQVSRWVTQSVRPARSAASDRNAPSRGQSRAYGGWRVTAARNAPVVRSRAT